MSQQMGTTLTEYLEKIEDTNESTAVQYRRKLQPFRDFIDATYNLSCDELIGELTQTKIDIYTMLKKYASYLNKERDVAPVSLKSMISIVRGYLQFFDIEISDKKFKRKVGLPRVVRRKKEAMEKSDVQAILNACPSVKLKTYVMLLAANGLRASEALSIRICDIDFDKDPVTIFIRGEFTKMKEDRTILLTNELVQQLKAWIEYKHRPREITKYHKNSSKTYVEKIEPKINRNVLLFSTRYEEGKGERKAPTIAGLYNDMAVSFENLLQRMGGKYAEFESSGKRRKYTLHSMRRHIKTVISDLGFFEFSEDWIGHIGSTYHNASMKSKIEIFRKIEPYLTFLDQTGLEKRSAVLESKVESLEAENISLKSAFEKRLEALEELQKERKSIGLQ